VIGLWREEARKKDVNGSVEFQEIRTSIYKWKKVIEMTGLQGGWPISGLRFAERATDFIQSDQTEYGVHPSLR